MKYVVYFVGYRYRGSRRRPKRINLRRIIEADDSKSAYQQAQTIAAQSNTEISMFYPVARVKHCPAV